MRRDLFWWQGWLARPAPRQLALAPSPRPSGSGGTGRRWRTKATPRHTWGRYSKMTMTRSYQCPDATVSFGYQHFLNFPGRRTARASRSRPGRGRRACRRPRLSATGGSAVSIDAPRPSADAHSAFRPQTGRQRRLIAMRGIASEPRFDPFKEIGSDLQRRIRAGGFPARALPRSAPIAGRKRRPGDNTHCIRHGTGLGFHGAKGFPPRHRV